MTFLGWLNSLNELQTELIGAKRTYWHFEIQKESEEYALYWREVCFAKCDNLCDCINIFHCIYKCYKIEYEIDYTDTRHFKPVIIKK